MKCKLRLIGVAALMAVTPIACSKKSLAPRVSAQAPPQAQAPVPAPASTPAPILGGGATAGGGGTVGEGSTTTSTPTYSAPPPPPPPPPLVGSAAPGEPSPSPTPIGRGSNDGPGVSLPPLDEAELLQNMIDSLPEAQTVFQHPEPMQVQRADKVTVRISRNMTADLTAPAIPLLARQRLITEHDSIKVTAFMRVRLSGDPYFKVDSLSDEEQLVDKDMTEWAFSVVPQKAGKWPLHLSITRVFRTSSGAEKVQDYSAKDEFVTVNVMPLGAALTSFGRSNWQWLWTTVVVPLAVFLWNHRRKKKAKAHHAGPKKTRAA